MEKRDRILVIDDERSICENVEKILAKNNFEVLKATSADEALERMAKESFSLLISDIIMPGKNGLELLKMVKKNWPLTKVVMMTAYASTDTAVKAIRLGALDYVAKPFTPDELRSTVNKALAGELAEAPVTEKEREAINIIDLDIPFDRDEVAKVTGPEYVEMLGPSDMPVVQMPGPEKAANFCMVGEMVCDIFKKLGSTCKAGVKTKECPQKKAKAKKGAGEEKKVDARRLIGIDMPFNYEEVAAVTGPEYIMNLHHDGVAFLPYEELKKRVGSEVKAKRSIIDADIPFDRSEVVTAAGESYADRVGPSDMPVVQMPGPETAANFCMVGEMVCDIFKKLGSTCKAGVKTKECPQKKAKAKKGAGEEKKVDARKLIGIDMPFNYEEVAAVTGPEYIMNLHHDGVAFLPYEELKKRVAETAGKEKRPGLVLLKKAGARAGGSVLVIDDEAAVNNNIRKILSKKGYSVDQAFTKEEALEKIAKTAYNLVLLDLKIPGVKGLELLKAVRDIRPEAMVVIITGYASIESAVETARMGAVDFLAKPFTPAEIRQAAENALSMAA